MQSGYASIEFLEFARKDDTSIIDEGILNLDECSPFPYFIVARRNKIFPKGANFIITPICLSGPHIFNIETGISQILKKFSGYQIAGGFIQTRDTYVSCNGYFENANCHGYLDSRTNYRIPLGLTDDELIIRMKRDSRSRVRKFMKNSADYQIIEVDNDHRSLLDQFSRIYEQTAITGHFPEIYRFNQDHWSSLLKNDKWKLYLLEYLGEIVSGTVITEVDGGFDFTFMGYIPVISDISRANIFFLYKYLSKYSGGYLDLGGGIIENDELARFKLSMGSIETKFKRIRFATKFYDSHIRKNSNYKASLCKRWP